MKSAPPPAPARPAPAPKLADAIARLGSEDAAEREAAAVTLSRDLDRARPELHALIRRGAPGQGAVAALRLLGPAGDRDDLPVLRDTLQAGGVLGWEAARALGHHSGEGALEILLAAVASDESAVAEAALAALPDRSEPAAREAIERALAHPVASRRFKAAVALTRAGAGPSMALVEARLAVETDADVRRTLEALVAAPPR